MDKNPTITFFSSLVPLLFFFVINFSSQKSSVSASCPAVRDCLSSPSTSSKDVRPCPFLPVPHAVEPSLKTTLELTPVRRSVWVLRDGWTRSLLVYHTRARRLIVVDAPSSPYSHDPGNGLPKQAVAINRIVSNQQARISMRRVDLVYGHRHFDHIGSMPKVYQFVSSTFPNARIRVWGTSETRTTLNRQRTQQGKLQMPPITNPIRRSARGRHTTTILRVRDGRSGGVNARKQHIDALQVRCIVVGGHTAADVALYIPPNGREGGVLHLTDLVAPGFAPFFNFGETIDLFKYQTTLQQLVTDFDFVVFSGGHGLLGNKSDVQLTLDYARDAIAYSKQANAKVTGNQLAQVGALQVFSTNAKQYGNLFYFLERRYHLSNTICSRWLVEKYGCILGGVAVASPFHCQTANIYNRIEVYS